MSISSKIEWTQATWNPVTGCKKVSPACKNCYAEAFAKRFEGIKGHPYECGFLIKLRPERLKYPLIWKKSKMIFVNSMSDLFLEQIPDSYIMKIFKIMSIAKNHIFQILTKRDQRMNIWTNKIYSRNKKGKLPWPTNIWLGVSIETQDYLYRIKNLQESPSPIKFISFEPLLSNISLSEKYLKGINWIIVGGESGAKARPMNIDWVENIFRVCKENNIPFFFKQWGEYDKAGNRIGKKRAGRIFRRKIWSEMPEIIPI